MHDRPLFLLDLDGPFNPHRAITPPPGYRRHDIRAAGPLPGSTTR
jgi:hypothetical protein